MRIGPLLPPRRRRPAPRDAAFIEDSRLSGIVLRMISLNSLGAFAQEVSRRPASEGVRGIAPSAGSPAGGAAAMAPPSAPSRTLDAVPPQPARPTPRGSLLDLRV